MAILETALTVAAPDSGNRARLLGALAGELTWHPDHHRRIALADEGVAVARRTGDPAALLDAILRPGPASWVPETSEHRALLFREAVELADRVHDPVGRIDAVGILASSLLERGAADRFEDDLDAAADLAVELREPLLRSMTLLTRCCLTIVRGNLELAEEQATEFRGTGLRSGDTEEGYSEVLGIIRWHQGRLAEALPHLRLALARMPDLPTRAATLALAEAVSGDPDEARILLRQAATKNFETHYGPAWLGGMCQWAAVATELGDTTAEAILYGKLQPWKELFGMSGPMPIHGVSHTLGWLAGLQENPAAAEEHFDTAWRTHHTPCTHRSTPPKPDCIGVGC